MKSWWLGWVVGVFLCFDLPAQAQITPGGSGTVVNQVGHQFNITGGTQSGRNLFHSFYQFGLNQGQVANFFSNPAIANILARVNGGSVSYINGLIQVLGGNSNLFLMNPAGIIFGPHASLNVPASFTATTADRIMFAGGTFNAYGDNQYSQLVGEPIGFVFSSSKPGIILNEGNLQVNPGQSLNLLAGQVINTGTLTAPGGSVSVTAVPGERWVRLSQPGHLLSFEFDRLEAANVMVDNNIPILRLPELVGARGAQSNSALTVQNNTVKLGNTTIPDQSGTAIISGKVDVSATNKTGGQVNVLGRQIALLNSEIDASGEMGGGKVFIGGNFQGKGPLPNAEYTLVDRNSTIKADALRVGNGGEVIVWADKTTQFYGTVSAKGGVAGGNGGFVEVSGKENLTFDGRVDTSAPQGRSGTLLLDPRDIFIGTIGFNDGEYG
jgi:filamentous hemagglutinin family protein